MYTFYKAMNYIIGKKSVLNRRVINLKEDNSQFFVVVTNS